MVPRTEVVAVQESNSLAEIAKVFEESGYSRLPVCRTSLDDIVGVLHSKDLVRLVNHPNDFRLEEKLIKPSYVVDTARLEDVLRQMQNEKFHFGFVVDEHGGVEGIITLEDLLEEIVGDISDEHDVEVDRQIAKQPDGTVILDGGLAVRDLNKRENMHLPVSDAYTTLAGFMMSRAGQVLSVGDTVQFNGHIFEVETMEKRRVRQIRMRKADTGEI
jgi:CBS domain containing-hemolysin-like protein